MNLGFITPIFSAVSSQISMIKLIIRKFEPLTVHHACKCGLDEHIHEYARKLGIDIVGHPTSDKNWRMFMEKEDFKTIYAPTATYDDQIENLCTHIVLVQGKRTKSFNTDKPLYIISRYGNMKEEI